MAPWSGERWTVLPVFGRKSNHLGVTGADVEFQAVVSSRGALEFPEGVAELLRSVHGSRVCVRVRSLDTHARLSARGVSDEEVVRIAAVQSEEREAVVRFLLSEGALRRGRRRSRG